MVQSTLSTIRHSEISYARFWTLIVHCSIEKLKILVMQDALMASVSIFQMTRLIISDSSMFSFIGSIPDVMFQAVPPSSKILEGYRKLTPSGPRVLTDEMQAILAEANNLKKWGRFKEGREENH